MAKITIALTLVLLYGIYSFLVYTDGTKEKFFLSTTEKLNVAKGKYLYRRYNCQACHQLYGLGGYLGPELTTAYSDKTRGELFMRALLETGGSRMPDFNLSKDDITSLIAYLKYVDSTATSIKTTGPN